jgi:structural maintenance of chromosomes protein 5
MKYDEAKSNYDDLKAKLLRCKQEFKDVKAALSKVQEQARKEAPLEDEDGNDLPLKTILTEDYAQFSTVDLAEAAKEEAERTLQEIVANPNAIRHYKDLEREIEELSADLDDLRNRKGKRKKEMEKLQQSWERSLEDTIGDVDKKFSQYMQELGCVGSVALSKGAKDDPNPKFQDYGIEIKVSFRQGVAPSVLSARVQSGGERSVSTIMYLMALQDEMKVPFRCVDEINQGLDERNERLVFKRIVENSTKPPGPNGPTDHCGQYWLITPKLLPNLTDMEVEAMTVLCIFNGPYNLKHPTDWDAEKLVNLRKPGRDGSTADAHVADRDDEMKAETEKIPKRRKRKSEEIEEAEASDDDEHDDVSAPKRTKRKSIATKMEAEASEEEDEVGEDEEDFDT